MEDFESTLSGESSEVTSTSEATREKSEKQKESYKKAQAQIQRAQKDEKKAKGDNDELFQILTRFIQNPYYETLVPQVTDLLTIALPSRPIIGMLALLYPDAAHHVFHAIGLSDRIHLMQGLHRYDELWNFHEKDLDTSIRDWISTWIDSFDKYIVMDGSSLIMQKKFALMIEHSESTILSGITQFLLFFFQSRNVIISYSVAESYSRFILKNIRQTLQKSLNSNPDSDMLTDESVADTKLFGLQ